MSQSSTSTCSTANDVPENIKDDIIRAADDWDLAKNKYYLNLQRKLHEKTASLERMRYVPSVALDMSRRSPLRMKGCLHRARARAWGRSLRPGPRPLQHLGADCAIRGGQENTRQHFMNLPRTWMRSEYLVARVTCCAMVPDSAKSLTPCFFSHGTQMSCCTIITLGLYWT